MGIIKTQGTQTLIVNLLGAVVGAVAVLFIYSSNDEIYGYSTWLFGTATLLMPLASFGALSLVVKFFPDFSRDDKQSYNGFLSLLLLILTGAFAVFLLFWQLVNPWLYKLLGNSEMDYDLYKSYQFYILILVFLFIILRFLGNQAANYFKIVIPNLIQQFGYKLFLPLLVLAYASFSWNVDLFSWAMIAFFAAAVIVMIIYLIQLGALKFAKPRRPYSGFRYSEMAQFSFFGALNQVSTGMAMRIDAVMIPFILGSTSFNSYYLKAFFIANFIEMPTRSLNQIANPIVSKAWSRNDTTEIADIYKKASNNLFVVGLYIFLGLWYCLDEFVQISSDPNSFPHLKAIFLLLGAAKLVDMITSTNSLIIGYSRLYKYNFAFMIFLGLLNLLLNLKFIPEHGIVGAAMASAISLFLYNLIKLLFIWKKFDMLPFSAGNLKSLLLAGIIFMVYFVWPLDINPLVDIAIKAIWVSAIYLPIAYFWKISTDINETVDKYLRKYKIIK